MKHSPHPSKTFAALCLVAVVSCAPEAPTGEAFQIVDLGHGILAQQCIPHLQGATLFKSASAVDALLASCLSNGRLREDPIDNETVAFLVESSVRLSEDVEAAAAIGDSVVTTRIQGGGCDGNPAIGERAFIDEETILVEALRDAKPPPYWQQRCELDRWTRVGVFQVPNAAEADSAALFWVERP